MKDQPPPPQPLWATLTPESRAVVSAMIGSFQRRIAELEEKLNRNSTGSSKSPSSDPPAAKRRPPSPPSDQRRGDSLAMVGWAKLG